MGGCRCSFRSCPRGTDGVTHFFHFPVKDVARCLAWIQNCQRPEFSALKMTQLKNKVICQYHFTDDMFLNYKHDRLIKRAVPTLAAINQTDYEEVTMSICLSPIKSYSEFPREKNIDMKKPFINMLQKYHSTPLVEDSVASINLTVESSPRASGSITSTNNTVVVVSKNNLQSASNFEIHNFTSDIKQKLDVVEIDPLYVQDQNENVSKPKLEAKTQNVSKPTLEAKTQNVSKPTLEAKTQNVSKPTLEAKTQNTLTPVGSRKKINVHSDIVLPEKSRINFVNVKGRAISKFKPNFSKAVKPRVSISAVKNDKMTSNLSLPSVLHTPELMISQTPVMKKSILSKAALVNEQLRCIGRDKILKQRYIKVENTNNMDSKSVSKENTQQNEYMKLILKTREEMAEIKKMLQEKPVQKAVEIVEETRYSNTKLSKEFLFAAIVPYLSAETSKKVHEEMFPSLTIS